MRKIYDNEILYFSHGKGTCINSGKEYDIVPGALVFIKPDTPHTFILDGDFKYMWVHFDFMPGDDQGKLWSYLGITNKGKRYVREDNELFYDRLPHPEWIRKQPVFSSDLHLPDYIKLPDREIIEILFKQLLFVYFGKKPTYKLKCKSILLDIITEIMKQESILNNDNNKLQDSLFAKIASYIERNYYKRNIADELEKITGLTRAYISSIIKKNTSMPAIRFINNYRVEKAREMLAQSDLKITEIADMVGFDDIHYFSKMYKIIEGVPPQNTRKMYMDLV